jgi:3-isopropylmalate/(R)-2-methylmalate dehydratase small subunit
MIIRGKVWRFGDDIDTDRIMPGAYSGLPYEEGAKHVMEGVAPGFAKQVEKGDIVVGGRNFGTGSSRESAPYGLKYAGIAAVVAQSFGRIFFRNAINIGLPVLVCEEAASISQGSSLEVDVFSGVIRDLTRGSEFHASPLPRRLRELLRAGGMVPYLEQQMAANTDGGSS